MGDIRGFLKIARKNIKYRDISERIKDFKPVFKLASKSHAQEQSARCMDCATPFCHSACPLGNYIPEWNEYLFQGNWKAAFYLLDMSNNMPEITARVCPQLCEYACVLGLNNDAVTIRENELAVIENAFKEKIIKPKKIKNRTGKKIAVIGSGPAGLSCADQLNKAGHSVVVFEKDNKLGGLLRYGIPDFKLEKNILDRRIKIWEKEGIVFKTGIEVGIYYSVKKLLKEFDAVCLAGGVGEPRGLNIEGRDLNGIYFAMEYLSQANKKESGEKILKEIINAKGKNVVVIGGGDTGADCVGTANRQFAKSITQIEVMPKPLEFRTQKYSWPKYPLLLKITSSHEEGGERYWSVLTKRFIGEAGKIKKLCCVKVEFIKEKGKNYSVMKEIPGTEFEIQADIVLLAIGFLHPKHSNLLKKLNIKLDERKNVKTDEKYMTSVDRVFSAGDMRRGQSLVVWAVSEGRCSAHYIDKYLMGESCLPLM
jgi:glutamate synthase (NADPH) small chain